MWQHLEGCAVSRAKHLAPSGMVWGAHPEQMLPAVPPAHLERDMQERDKAAGHIWNRCAAAGHIWPHLEQLASVHWIY